MRPLTCVAIIAAIAISCNQTPNADSTKNKPVTDLASENLKSKIQQVDVETYLIDSATGKQGKLESKSTEKYDDNGYTISYSNYNAEDSSTTVNTYDHNKDGYFTGMQATKNGKPLNSMKVDIDNDNKYTLAKSFDSTGKVDVFYDSILVNEYVQILSAVGHHPDSTLKMTFTNNFDSIYYVGGESKDSVGKLTYSSTIKLNDKKDPQQIDETTATKDSIKKTTSTYAYDEWDNNGNWTKQTVTENGKPAKIVVRTITYKQ